MTTDETDQDRITRRLAQIGRARRDAHPAIREANRLNIPKARIADLTGYARSSIDRILARPDQTGDPAP